MDHRARLGKAIDDMCNTKSCLDIFDRALKAKDEEIKDEQQRIDNLYRTEFDTLLATAVQFAELVAKGDVSYIAGFTALTFLASPEVQAWKKGRP